MGVRLEDLPAKAREQVARKMMGGSGRRIATSAVPPRNDSTEGKYHNQKAVREVEGSQIIFDSQKEARRFDELVLLERAGKIRDLKLQVDFTLQEAYTMAKTGNRVRAIRYRADFTYLERVADDFARCAQGEVSAEILSVVCEDSSICTKEPKEESWRLVVEDVKSEATRTRVYAVKRKLMMDKYGIAIREV